jgi:hypothetical protein
VQRWSRKEIVTVLGVDEPFIVELEAEELVHADDGGMFNARQAERIRLCWTWMRELGANLEGAAVALQLVERLEEERRQVREVLRRLRERVESDGGDP